MLVRKMAREIRKNLGQFLSLFVLSFLAVSLFACMKASNISAYNKLDDLRKENKELSKENQEYRKLSNKVGE